MKKISVNLFLYTLCLITLAAAASSTLAAPAKPESIDLKQLTPGNSIVIDLPSLGPSWRSDGKNPVQMRVLLPSNFSPQKPHPALVHLSGGAGDISGQLDHWSKLFKGKNFVLVGVDYTLESGHSSGPKNAIRALQVVINAMKIDRDSLVLSGLSSGAYAITNAMASRELAAFQAFVVINGGMTIQPRELGNKRPVLNIAGEEDRETASAGRPRIDVQKECHELLKKNGLDSTLVLMPGVGHEWPTTYDRQILEWFYNKLPVYARWTALYKQSLGAPNPERKIQLQRQLAQSWLDLPGVAEARKAAASAEKSKKPKQSDPSKVASSPIVQPPNSLKIGDS